MPEGYLHLTCEQRCQIYALSAKRPLASPHRAANWRRSVDDQPRACSQHRRARLSLQASAREGLAETRRGLGQAAQNDARFGGADRRKTDARAVESRSDQRPSGEGWRRLYQSRAHLSACLERQERRGALYLHLRHSGKKYNRRKGKNWGAADSEPRRYRSAASFVAAKSRIGDWEADTIIGANHKGVVMSHVSEPPNTPSSPNCRTRTGTLSCRPAHACSCRSLTASKQSLTTMEKSSPLTPKSQPRWGRSPILPSPITRGNAASTNTLTASSGSTSQKVPTSLFCPMPMSKGSRTNSTLAPERYSATKPLARFSSAPEICPLHFTVEWARFERGC